MSVHPVQIISSRNSATQFAQQQQTKPVEPTLISLPTGSTAFPTIHSAFFHPIQFEGKGNKKKKSDKKQPKETSTKTGSTEKLFPALKNALSDKDLIRTFGQHPLMSDGLAEALQYCPASKFEAQFEDFMLGLLLPLNVTAGEIQALQEDRNLLQSDEREGLEVLEDFMPESIQGETYKPKALVKLFSKYLIDQWSIPRSKERDQLIEQHTEKKAQHSHIQELEPNEIISILSRKNGHAKELYVELKTEKQKLKKQAITLSPVLRQFLTGFQQAYPESIDMTLKNVCNYVYTLAQEEAIPQEIQKVAAKLAQLRQAIEESIAKKELVQIREAFSLSAFQTRLKNLSEQNKLTEKQTEQISGLISQLEQAGSGSHDGQVLSNRLDILLNRLPWDQTPPKEYNQNALKLSLDEDHYGLETVKTAILTHMGKEAHVARLKKAGRYKKASNHRPLILLLDGPPGVGKSSLARSIAKATNRNFVRISLGGVSDEAEIRGHRSAYIGSEPGRIIQALIYAKSTNPVILLDEIDKLGRDYKGDPAAALLEVLDPEQNKTFRDNLLGVEVDLSNCLFIATSNTLGTIPEALKDRFQIIQLKGYTEEEKVSIAQKHLIPKAQQGNGIDKESLQLTKEPFQLTREKIQMLIRKYAPEKGVRQLENAINTLAQKMASEVINIPLEEITLDKISPITNDTLDTFLKDFKPKGSSPRIGFNPNVKKE